MASIIRDCIGESHAWGGPADIWFEHAETLLPQLQSSYAEQVQLIYLDPPFGTGDRFQVNMGSRKNPVMMTAYSDNMPQEQYLSMLRTILEACHSLLRADGSLYLHIDYRMSAQLRLMLDEIFGADNFMNEIIWAYKSGGRSTKSFSKKHDTILFYRKSKKVYFNIKAVGVPRGSQRRNHMKRAVDKDGRVYFTIRSSGKVYTYYEDSLIYPNDVWTDIEHLHQKDPERTGFLTQKPEALLTRILLASSEPGALVADFFSGSGTTAAVATRLGRRFIGCDASTFSIHVQRNRLLKQSMPVSMFKEAQPLTLHYCGEPFPLPEDLPNISVQQMDQQTVLHVSQTSSSQIVYAAAGVMRDHVFHAAQYCQSPDPIFELSLPQTNTPVLHLADVNGKQVFLSL